MVLTDKLEGRGRSFTIFRVADHGLTCRCAGLGTEWSSLQPSQALVKALQEGQVVVLILLPGLEFLELRLVDLRDSKPTSHSMDFCSWPM